MKVNYKKLITMIGGKCWNIKEFLQNASIQAKAFYDIKAGKDTLNIKTIGKIAKALDVDVSEILEIE